MPSDILVTALATLEEPTSALVHKKIATEALLVAVVENVSLPPGAAFAIWSFWKSTPANRAWRHSQHLGNMPDDRVRAEGIELLEREDANEEQSELAIDVLVGKAHAAHVSDAVMLGLFERAADGVRAQQVARLVEAVHEARGIEPSILRTIRDRWAASAASAVRETSISIAAEIAEPDMAFVERMLADPDADVRGEMAQRLDAGMPGRELAIGLVEARLRVEVHPRARAALLRLQASLVDEGAERRRRRS